MAGTRPADAPEHFAFRAMASPCELQLQGEAECVAAAARDAREEVLRIERKYTRYEPDSVTSMINDSAGSASGIEVDDETAGLLDYAATAWAWSDGLFDISSGVLREVWDFRSGRVPTQAQLSRVLEHVGWQRVRWQDRRLWLAPGMQIDFGGFGKEYAADRAAQCCRDRGVASGLVDLGGDISIVGPHSDGQPWRVGIRDPDQVYGAVARIDLDHGAVATSGDYQRCMWVDGKRYAHILDPHTGWPVAGMRSVSVVASHCLLAGTASTIAMLRGEEGAAWLDELGLPNLRVDQDGFVGGSLARTDAKLYGTDSGMPGAEPSMRSAGGFATASSPGNTTT